MPPPHPRLHLMQNRRDQRRHPRRVVDRPARIILVGGNEPCRINDISEGGARLWTASSSWLPHIFDLEDVFSGVRRAAARVWSKQHFIGVRFLDSAPNPPATASANRKEERRTREQERFPALNTIWEPAKKRTLNRGRVQRPGRRWPPLVSTSQSRSFSFMGSTHVEVRLCAVS